MVDINNENIALNEPDCIDDGGINIDKTTDTDTNEVINNIFTDDASDVPGEEKKSTVKKHRFAIALLIYCSALTIVFAAGLFVLWRYLVAYEKSLPDTAVEEFIEGIDADFIQSMLSEIAAPYVTPFEDADEIIRNIASSLDYDSLICIKDRTEYTSDNPVYVIMSGSRKLFRVWLVKSGEPLGFGLYPFKAGGFDIYSDTLFKPEFSINAAIPEGAVIYVNGIAVDEKYAVGKMTSNDFSTLENPEVYSEWTKYKIKNLYFEPQYHVELDGVHLDWAKSHDTYVFFEPGTGIADYTLTVPKKADVTVNGRSIGDEYLTSGGSYDTNGYETKGEEYKVYTFTGLFTPPDITIKIGDKEYIPVRDDLTYTLDYPSELKYKAVIDVPKGYTPTVNGVKLTDDYIVDTKSAYAGLEEFSKYLKLSPTVVTYEIDGFFKKPDVKVDGCDIVITEEDNKILFDASRLPTDKIKSECIAAAEEYVKRYIHYMSRGFDNLDENYKSVVEMMISGTASYKMMGRLKSDSLVWVTPATTTYNSFSTRVTRVYSDECVVCESEYDVTQNTSGIKNNHSGKISVVLIKANEKWLVASITLSE